MLYCDVQLQPMVGRLVEERGRWCVAVMEYEDGSFFVGQYADETTCSSAAAEFEVQYDRQETHIVFVTHRGVRLCLTDDRRDDGTDTVRLELCREAQTNQKWTHTHDGRWLSLGAHLVHDPKQCLSAHKQYQFATLRAFDATLIMKPCSSDRRLQAVSFVPLVPYNCLIVPTHKPSYHTISSSSSQKNRIRIVRD